LDLGADFMGGVTAYLDDELVYAEDWDHYWNWDWTHDNSVVKMHHNFGAKE